MLEFAYTLYLAGMCECGHPRHICQHWDNDGWFTVETTQCHAKAAIERFTSDATYKAEPGELVFTTYTRPASKPLPPFVVLDRQPSNGEANGANDQKASETTGAGGKHRYADHKRKQRQLQKSR